MSYYGNRVNLPNRIVKKISTNWPHAEVTLDDESHNHHNRGQFSHLRLRMIDSVWDGIGLLERHKKIYALLKEEMNELHALALEVYTPPEWERRAKQGVTSPLCSKKS